MDNDTSNLYQTPEARLDAIIDTKGNYSGPKHVPFSLSLQWISKGFELFKRSPGGWLLTMLVGFLMSILANFIPLVNLVYGLFMYVFVGGIFIGAQKVYEGEKFEVSYLFAGFSRYPGRLILLGLMPLLMAMFVGVLAAVFLPAYQGFVDQGGGSGAAVFGIILGVIMMLVTIPFMMAVWFSPVLIVLHELPLTTAMKESFYGCARNLISLIVLMVISIILMMIGGVLAIVGLFVVMPILFGANFAAYQDIFLTKVE